nr:putative carbohydrate binding domain containing protein [uncultured Mediterranean phage uvMED]
MSEIKVNSIKGVGASAAAITVNNSDGTCTANITNKPNRNLIINGAMQVAQRGTSVASTGYKTVDRMNFGGSWPGSAITQSQSDVASETTPYTLGFRKAYKIVNSNQSSAGAAYYIVMTYKTEAQDLATSGWNYKSASSYITVSFWVKSSVAQNFYVRFQTKDGGSTYNYPFETGSLTADTWTKVTHSIPGNSNLTIDNDSGEGPKIQWAMYRGSNDTSSSVTLNQWAAYSDGTKTPDYTAAMDDWFLTNGATFEITGLQLEVGSVATDFEHRSFGDELHRCQRYFFKTGNVGTSNEWFPGVATNADYGNFTTQGMSGLLDRSAPSLRFPCYMRTAGTVVFYPGRSGTANTANNINGFVSNTLITTSGKPSASVGGLQGYFQGTSEDKYAYVFQCTVDSEL